MATRRDSRCTRCGGWYWTGADAYGRYLSCINCGHYAQTEEPSTRLLNLPLDASLEPEPRARARPFDSRVA